MNNIHLALLKKKLSLVNKIIKLDKSYENILLRNSSWGAEYEYWKLYELRELLSDLKRELKLKYN